MSKRLALRTLKQERRADVWAYLAAISPDPVRVSHKARRAAKQQRRMAEMRRP